MRQSQTTELLYSRWLIYNNAFYLFVTLGKRYKVTFVNFFFYIYCGCAIDYFSLFIANYAITQKRKIIRLELQIKKFRKILYVLG